MKFTSDYLVRGRNDKIRLLFRKLSEIPIYQNGGLRQDSYFPNEVGWHSILSNFEIKPKTLVSLTSRIILRKRQSVANS